MKFLLWRLLVASILIAGCSSENDTGAEIKIYSKAIHTAEWCGLGVRYGHFLKLTQVSDRSALFTGQGFRILLPVDQIDAELIRGMTIIDAAKYIGYVKTFDVKNVSGFNVKVDGYHVISKPQFLAAKVQYDRFDCELNQIQGI